MSPIVLLQIVVALTVANIAISMLSYYYTNRDVDWVVDKQDKMNDGYSSFYEHNERELKKIREAIKILEESKEQKEESGKKLI